MHWRIELSQYCYDIVFREGKFKVVPDILSHVYCGSTTVDALYRIHANPCHPGVTRMYHYIHFCNLPYSLDDVKCITEACSICCEVKPRFYKPPSATLIKCSQPFERLSMDFKGPLPLTKNHYFLTVIYEFSRFPFIFPCSDIRSQTVISCLKSLFSLLDFLLLYTAIMQNVLHLQKLSSFFTSVELRVHFLLCITLVEIHNVNALMALFGTF